MSPTTDTGFADTACQGIDIICGVAALIAGLLLMIWHILIGLRIIRPGQGIPKTETGMKTLIAGAT